MDTVRSDLPLYCHKVTPLITGKSRLHARNNFYQVIRRGYGLRQVLHRLTFSIHQEQASTVQVEEIKIALFA